MFNKKKTGLECRNTCIVTTILGSVLPLETIEKLTTKIILKYESYLTFNIMDRNYNYTYA